MKERKTQSETLYELSSGLPEFCEGFLIRRSNERALNTRLGYARDLDLFFDWLIAYHPHFSVLNKREITTDDMKKVSTTDIDRFLDYYSESHAVTTVARMRAAISAIFKYLCIAVEKLEKNPVAGATKVKIASKDYVIYLTREEQEILLNCIMYGTGLSDGQLKRHSKLAKRDLAMIFLFLDTGLRVSELQGIDIGDVNINDCFVIVRRKGGKLSQVYFSDEEREYLNDYLEEKRTLLPMYCGKDDPLFTSTTGSRITVREIQKLVPKYVSAALPQKTDHISPHKLRSSFAMSFYASERDILALQVRMNHKSLNTTNIYAKAYQNVSEETRNWRNK